MDGDGSDVLARHSWARAPWKTGPRSQPPYIVSERFAMMALLLDALSFASAKVWTSWNTAASSENADAAAALKRAAFWAASAHGRLPR